jgi:hypothetical protein
LIVPVWAQAQDEPAASADTVVYEQVAESNDPAEIADEAAQIEERRSDEASLIEDPEAQRRARALAAQQAVDETGREAEDIETSGPLELYASARAHVINNYNVETGTQSTKVGDGNSRAGIRAEWEFNPGWYLYGRGEVGLNLFDNYTTRGEQFGDDDIEARLAYVGVDHKNVSLVAGKNWSAYYQVAGLTDRFAIFGGSASGVYNARTSGDATGTGRADDVIQTRLYVTTDKSLFQDLKPFNVNLQYQLGQSIPFVSDEKYDYSYGASAFLETNRDWGIGFAYNLARVPDGRMAIQDAGIDGDARALALTTRMYGNRWYVGVLFSRLENMETTDQNRYFDGTGIELYAQWEVRDNWWLIGGGNMLDPDSGDPDAGMYRVRYTVLGGRYTFDSFKRMAYVEYRFDEGRQFDGGRNKDELTIGMRWDFGE